jgi:hypothetical protein
VKSIAVTVRQEDGSINGSVSGGITRLLLLLLLLLLAEIPGVARDSIRNEGTREINYGIIKK